MKRKGLSLAAYSRKLNMNRTALNVAMRRGHLSPRMAGAIARDIGEDVQRWIAIAAMERTH